MNRQQREKISNDILNIAIVALALLIGLWVVPAFLGGFHEDYKHTFYGLRPYVVKSDSMEPAIRQGALLIGRVTQFGRLQVGDVITFETNIDGQNQLNTHRIVEKQSTHVITKGENAAAADPMPVTPRNFRYRVVVVWNGAARLGTARGVLLYLVLPFVGLIALAGGSCVLFIKIHRKKVAPAQEPELDLSIENISEDENDLLGLIESTLNRAEQGEDDEDEELDLLLEITAALHCAQKPKENDDEEDFEWFDQLMLQKGIALG